MSKTKTICTLIAALFLTPLASGANAEPPTWAKQKKTDVVKEAKPGTGPGMEGGKSHAKPKGKAHGVYGTQPSKTMGEETQMKGKGKKHGIKGTQPSSEEMEQEAGQSMIEKGKGKAKGEYKNKKPK